MSKENIIIISIIAVILLALWGWQSGWFAKEQTESVIMPEGLVLFFGDGCPYCKVVEDFISENNLAEKVPFTNLEIAFRGKTSPKLKANSELLVQAALNCKMDVRGGVNIPFLYDGGNKSCLIGEPDIIKFFKDKAGIQ